MERTMYPFDEIIHLVLYGFIERHFNTDEIKVGFRFQKHRKEIYNFLQDKQYEWIAEKTIRFIAQLNEVEANMLNGKEKFNASNSAEIDRLIAIAIAEVAAYTLYAYYNPNPIDENIYALEMSKKKIQPNIPNEIIDSVKEAAKTHKIQVLWDDFVRDNR